MSLKINKKLLIRLVQGWLDDERYEIVVNEVTDTSRWSIQYECILKDKSTGNYYDASYQEGATEMQDESAFDNNECDSDGCLELDEVEPYETTVIKYRNKNHDQFV